MEREEQEKRKILNATSSNMSYSSDEMKTSQQLDIWHWTQITEHLASGITIERESFERSRSLLTTIYNTQHTQGYVQNHRLQSSPGVSAAEWEEKKTEVKELSFLLSERETQYHNDASQLNEFCEWKRTRKEV